mgnify:CR=1 FL=1
MAIVFRTSSFFIVVVITLKATTFVMDSASGGHGVADRLSDRVERLIDEGFNCSLEI